MRRTVSYENSLEYCFSGLAAEWDYERNRNDKPRDFSCGSHYKASWKCDKGHVWSAEIKSRVSGTGCPYCNGKKVLAGVNDFKTKNPEKMWMWDYSKNKGIDPSRCMAGSDKKVWWKCKRGHQWQAKIGSISRGGECPYCSSEKLLKGFNDLETLFPEISKLWDFEMNTEKPSEVFPKSSKFVNWRCSKGHKWNARVYSVVNRNGSCPICSRKRISKGISDFATIAGKELLDEWNYELNTVKPDMVSPHNSKQKYWWKCKKCGNEWQATTHHRVDRGYGCPYCSGKKVITGKNDLETLYPDLAVWWSKSNKKPMCNYSIGSAVRAKWVCPSCEGEFERRITDHIRIKTCPFCSGKRVIIGKNDLATTQTELVKEWNYKRNRRGPECYSEHSNKKVWWICSICGYELRAMINNRSKGEGCPRCYKGDVV